MSECAVEGCDRPVNAKGWCKTHYMYSRRGHDMSKAKPIETQPGYSNKWAARLLVEDLTKDPVGVLAAEWSQTDEGKRFVDLCRDGEVAA